MPNLVLIQLTMLYWLASESVKVCILRFSQQKSTLETSLDYHWIIGWHSTAKFVSEGKRRFGFTTIKKMFTIQSILLLCLSREFICSICVLPWFTFWNYGNVEKIAIHHNWPQILVYKKYTSSPASKAFFTFIVFFSSDHHRKELHVSYYFILETL